jgi:hypothetical protein
MAKCKIHSGQEEPCVICNVEATTSDVPKKDEDDKK